MEPDAPRAQRVTSAEPTPVVDWDEYAAAVHRWELITGRDAPYPTQPGRHGRPVLAPPFVEWLMGLPPGWATDEHLDLPRTAQLRALGNGVVPQQAEHALRLLLDDLAHLEHTCGRAPAAEQPRRHPARPNPVTRARAGGPRADTSRPSVTPRSRSTRSGASSHR